ncbi:F-box/kelch-repeat protein at5g39560 [Phtheirospermum japonicum]|uniref:F-box/kelch-repeat protein at5g39560 n=1 Tax=Phtheirospermum japonicum TaxID=374723 RepID=A0A830BKS2_9LAMI|nr:F-box/kelch-repeat protein at5g39560 [Phtheirospermum japonicum]
MKAMENRISEMARRQIALQSAVQKQIEDLSLRLGGFTQEMEEIIVKKMSEAINEIGATAAGNKNLNPNVATTFSATRTQTKGTSDAADTDDYISDAFRKLSASRSGSSEGIRCFYMIYDCWNEDPYSFNCFAMNKSTGETTALTISPAPDTKGHERAPRDLCHRHAEVRFFNTLRPEDGWRDAAPMHIPRLKPAAVVIDGMIYVLGGSSREHTEDGECYDPKTNQWRLFSAVGCRPYFACIQAPYVGPNGAKKVLVHSDHQDMETLYSYAFDKQQWEIVSDDFGKCTRPGAVVGDIIYAVLDNYDEKQPLHGYHLVHKRWFPVELPEVEICNKTAWVFASGSDRLCLVWYHFDVRGKGENNRMECLELRLNESYTTGSDGMMLLNLTATKVSSTYLLVQHSSYRKSILAL